VTTWGIRQRINDSIWSSITVTILVQNKKRINLKIIDRVSQHEFSYLLEGLKKMDEFEFVINSKIEEHTKVMKDYWYFINPLLNVVYPEFFRKDFNQ
jgi:hypothetical protein